MTTTIKPDSNLSQIIEKYPKIAHVLLEYGLHCVGCELSKYETIEQGARAHGFSDELIKAMMEEINLVVSNKPDYPLNPEGITISPRAIELLIAIQGKDEKYGYGLRIFRVEQEGKVDYELDLAKHAQNDELKLTWEGQKIFINQDDLDKLKPCIVDHINLPDVQGFKIIQLN